MTCPRCGKPEAHWFKPYCSPACKQQGPAQPVDVNFSCRWCKQQVTFKSNTNEAKEHMCSKSCYDRFKVHGCAAGEAMLNFLFTEKTHQMGALLDDADLARVGMTSRTLQKPALRAQLGPWYEDHTAIHYDSRRGEMNVARDTMVEIAVQSYHTAMKLAVAGVPVILYRVSDRDRLTRQEEQTQTVAGAVRTADNIWPIERTAAWIQGAMRARVPFVLLTDPRVRENLVGGKDRSSDAVYVRELFQICLTGYHITGTSEGDLPTGLRRQGYRLFKLVATSDRREPMPLVPKLSRSMEYDNTWDSSKSSLSLKDDNTTGMADFLVDKFLAAAKTLGDIAYQ